MEKISVSTLPEIDVDTDKNSPWICILYNDAIHSFDEVIEQVIKATGYTYSKASKIVEEAHLQGKSIVYSGEIEACLKVIRILEEIYLLTEIQS
jgi:ATP-dependent Clp protease adaptor protein ClpS